MIGAAEVGLLDDPIWAALTTGNRAFAEGGPLAWRYPPEVAPFAAIANKTGPAFAGLATLVPPEGRVALFTVDPLVPPAFLAIDMQAPLIQMVLNGPIASARWELEHVVLGSADVSDMLDLAGRTRPGPSAIALYKKLGFVERRVLHLTVLASRLEQTPLAPSHQRSDRECLP